MSPVEGAVEEARGRVVRSYLDAAWRKPPITSRTRERGDAQAEQAERLVNAMVNRFDEGPLADLIAAARSGHDGLRGCGRIQEFPHNQCVFTDGHEWSHMDAENLVSMLEDNYQHEYGEEA